MWREPECVSCSNSSSVGRGFAGNGCPMGRTAKLHPKCLYVEGQSIRISPVNDAHRAEALHFLCAL